MNQIHRPILSMVAGVAMLGGCAEQRAGMVSRFLSDDSARTAYSAAPAALAAGRPADSGFGAGSDIIARLQARRSVLTPASPYDQVAEAVLAADARVAESELRAAQLRAEAASRNWLPTIGPRISLTSLGELVADLVINQVLFDNGRKQAERDLAQAEVELAAVALAEDGNTRVNAALTLYLRMEEGRETAALLDHSLGDMAQFEWVMDQRVRGGVSDMSDLNVVRQKLADIRARSMAAREQVTTAQAELAAMATRPLGDLHGQTGLGAAPGGLEATAVLRARAEMARALAQAQIERAAHLPGLSAGGSTGGSGQNLGLQVQTDQLFGLGTVASLNALKVTAETAARRVVQAREESDRKLQSQQRQLEALRRQGAEAQTLRAQARANLDLFQRQYDGGQRQVMDVVGVYETYARAADRALELRFAAARAELEIARIRGVLADGTLM